MVAPIAGSQPGSIRSLPAVSTQVEPTQLKSEPALPASDFQSAKAKLVNVTGARPALARPVKTNADLALEVAQQRAGGAPASTRSAAVEKSLARLNLPAATGAELATALASLDPSQQLQLIKALPYAVRTKLEAERAKLPADQRGPSLSYLGDKGITGLAKDGQIAITPGGTVFIDGRRTPTSWPAKIDLGNGKKITVTNEGGVFTLKMGDKKLRAVPDIGGWKFLEASTSPKNGDLIDANGKAWRPLTTADQDQWLMVSAFREGAVVSAGIDGNLDPATSELFRDQQITAQIPAARKALDSLTVESAKLTGWVNSSAASFAESQKLLGPALKAGYVKMSTDSSGRVSLSLNRPSGMRDSEWQKIQTEFGPKVAAQSKRFGDDQQWLGTQIEMRDQAAYGVLNTFRSAPFQKYLASLSPTERVAELTRMSESLKGSSAGRSFAADLFGPSALSASLEPTTALSKTALEGAWSTPASREAMKKLALSVSAQLPQDGVEGLQRTFEINLGRPLTSSERKVAEAIQSVKSPDDLEKLSAAKGKSAPGPLDKAGDFADLLSELGSAPEAEKLALSVTNPFQKTSVGFNRGASFVATVQVLRSGAAMFKEGLTADTGLSFAEDATRAIGTWGALLNGASKASKVMKLAGPVSDAIGLVNDLRRDASSSEGQHDNNIHVGASALILAGGLVGGPFGVAGVMVGLGVKLFYNRTSESYEDMHARLKKTFF